MTEEPRTPHGADSGGASALTGWRTLPRRGRGLNLSTLIVLRWLAIIGQSAAILTAYFYLHFPLPLAPCLLLIAASAAMNIGAMRTITRGENRTEGNHVAVQLGFDIIQLSGLLGLTGGLDNPFSILLVAPVTIAAATLRTRYAVLLGMLAVLAVMVLYHWSLPLPWQAGETLQLPVLYRFGMGLGLVTGMLFTAGYAWRVAEDAEKLELALATTQDVLQREQRMAALGGLAAAAAHELGTPLATIQVVAKEMLRGAAPDSPAAEDAALMLQQADRCREILKKLSQRPEDGDILYADVGLKALLEEVIAPHEGFDLEFTCTVRTADGRPPPRVQRLPEILHGLSTLVENAADFAASTVRVNAVVDAGWIEVEVVDDGPGFAHEILPRLGQPYVTSRPHGKTRRALSAQIAAAAQRAAPPLPGRKSRKAAAPSEPVAPSQGGMGLGFFIARTLLERTGGRVGVGSAEVERSGLKPVLKGARVTVRWPRPALEVPQETAFEVSQGPAKA